MKKLSATILLTILVFITAFRPPAISSNSKAPNFSLPDLSGKIINLSDYKGKTIFLNFFATWCPPCREEMPSIEKLYKQSSPLNLTVLTVAIDKKGIGPVSRFIEENKYTFKVLLDPKNKAADKYEVKFVPTSFIINRKGEIVDKVVGGRDWADPEMLDKFRKLAK